MNDDFLLDEEDDDLENDYYVENDETDEEESDGDSAEQEYEDDSKKGKVDDSLYEGKMTKDELWLSSAYDNIVAASKQSDKDSIIKDAVTIVISANPKHTSTSTVNYIAMDLLQKQGKARMVNSLASTLTPMRGEDVDMDLDIGDDTGFNKQYAQEAKNQIARFIEFLANRDLSKDSIISKRRKQRHIPAFIIFLFSSGMYDLILGCPTMPEEYEVQINNAMKKILKAKYDIVEELAAKYESVGRDKVAERVRKLQLAWFDKEPAEIMSSAEYGDLDITYDDVLIYKEFRGKFTNTSKAITQDVISDLIEVVVNKDAGIYERLKDKTRSDAISDVKQVYKDWAKNNPIDSELASKVIWKDINGLKNNN